MNQHRAPIVDKSLLLLGELAGQTMGLTLNELSARLKVPRSTVYRALNSLMAYRFVVKPEGSPHYKLGPRIDELSGLSSPGNARARLIAAATPAMERLTRQLREACKLSVAEGDEVVTIHAVASPADYGLAVKIGRRGPIHTGGSGKALLAFWPEPERERIVSGPLAAFTPSTITDSRRLRDTLSVVRQRGFAEDDAELRAGIRSVAAPIFANGGAPIAALSVPYLGDPGPERVKLIADAVVATAREIGGGLA